MSARRWGNPRQLETPALKSFLRLHQAGAFRDDASVTDEHRAIRLAAGWELSAIQAERNGSQSRADACLKRAAEVIAATERAAE